MEHLLVKGTATIGTTDVEAERGLFEHMDRLHASAVAAAGSGDTVEVQRLRDEIDELEDEARTFVVGNEFDRILSRAGAQGLNAATTSESTTYFVELPANRAELFFALRNNYHNLVGFKEFGGADSLTYAAEQITSGDDDLTLMVGVDTQVVHGFINCGATGAITGIGNALPGPVLELVDLCQQAQAGDADARRRAEELGEALQVLSKFDEGPDLVLYYKYLLELLGDERYRLHFNATDALSDSQRAFAESQLQQFQAWHSRWQR